MMRRIVWITFLAAATVALAWWVAFLPGAVTLSIADVTMQASTPVAAVAVFLAVLAIHLVLRLVTTLLALPARLRGWRQRARRRDGDAAVTRALVALAAGDAPVARRAAARARAALGDTAQTLLLDGEAARLAGDPAAANTTHRTLAARSDGAFLGLRGLFRQAIDDGNWAEAADLARRAEALQPGGTWLREARLLLASQTGAWRQALSLVGPDLPEAVLATAASHAEADPAAAAILARRAWKADPGFTPAVLVHASFQRREGRDRRAEEIIVEAWKLAPHPDLADFLLADQPTAMARLRAAAALTRANPEHGETHFLLARLSLDAGLPGEARFHAARARERGVVTRRLPLLLADLAAAEGQDTTPALREAAASAADPAWRCAACGTTHVQWGAACETCHAVGRTVWAAPQPRAEVKALSGR